MIFILLLYIIPIIITIIRCYIDMKKGKSIEEYIGEILLILLLIPYVNIIIVTVIIVAIIFDKIKHLKNDSKKGL